MKNRNFCWKNPLGEEFLIRREGISDEEDRSPTDIVLDPKRYLMKERVVSDEE